MYKRNITSIGAIFAIVFLVSFGSLNSVFAQEEGSLEVFIQLHNGLRASPSGATIEIYQDSNDEIFRAIPVTTNPVTIPALPLNHNYKLEIYYHGILANFDFVKMEESSQNMNLPVPGNGGLQFILTYKDGETPIEGAEIDVYAYSGKHLNHVTTYSQGESPRIWLPVTGLNDEDYFYADIHIGENITKRISPITINKGSQELRVVTEWPPLVDKLFTVKVFESPHVKLQNYKGYFVEMYDKQGNFVDKSKVYPTSEAYFSNFPVKYYNFILKYEIGNQTDVLAQKLVPVTGSEDSINLVISQNGSTEIESNSSFGYTIRPFAEESDQLVEVIEPPAENISGQVTEELIPQEISKSDCNCVSFRFSNVQDFYLNEVQVTLINLFDSKNAGLTIGISGNSIGDDPKVVDTIKEKLPNGNLLLANRGWEFTKFTELTDQQQSESIRLTNERLGEVFGKSASTFIAPYNEFNDGTIKALRDNGMTYLSSSSGKDPGPHDFQSSIPYHVPYTIPIKDLISVEGQSQTESIGIIQESLDEYGFAVINLQSQNFAQENESMENLADMEKVNELVTLIDALQTKGIKIVTLDKIPKMSTYSNSPTWIDTIYMFYEQGKISHEDLIKAVNYLVSKSIIKYA